MARRYNVTGIQKLSLGTTKNNRGYVLKRYLINAYDDEGNRISKSFYFGVKCTQMDAFLVACQFLKESGEKLPGVSKLKAIFKQYGHDSIL